MNPALLRWRRHFTLLAGWLRLNAALLRRWLHLTLLLSRWRALRMLLWGLLLWRAKARWRLLVLILVLLALPRCLRDD